MEGRLYAAALSAFLAAFALEAWGLGFWWSELSHGHERVKALAEALDREGRETTRRRDEATALVEELAFLQSLPNLLPADKGYQRTQKAVAEEVRALRLKLARRVGGQLHILVDAKANKLYLKKGFETLLEADCSVGRGGILRDKRTGRRWEFVTPRGEFRVIGKAADPEWRKPDWAYVEAGEPVPPPDDPARLVKGELGAYVLNLGDGYLIHGTRHEHLLGRPASHGCVRVGAEALEKLYQLAGVGTRVFIFY